MTRRKPDDDRPLTLGDLREAIDKITKAMPEQVEDVGYEVHNLEGDVRGLREAVDELGRAHDAFVDWIFDVYDWFQAGMPDEGARRLRLAANAERSTRRVDEVALAYNEHREPDGSGPTQEVVAEALLRSDRTLRKIGWARIVARADELMAESPE